MSNYKSYFLKSLGLTEDALPGGKGDETTPHHVSPEELKMGIKVEMEHTHDPSLAKEIALDHLTEDPQYYTHLKAGGLADELPEGQQPKQGPMQMSKLMSPSSVRAVPIIGVAVRGSSTGGYPGGGMIDKSDKARYGGLEPVKNQKANSQGTTEHTDQFPDSNGTKLTPSNDCIGQGAAPVTAPKGNEDIHPHQVQQLGTPPPEDDGTGRSGKVDVKKKTDGPSTTDDDPEEPKRKKVWGIDMDDKGDEDDEDDEEEGEEVSIDIKESKQKVCFHCKQSRPCKCDKKDDEDREASDPESPKFDSKRFGNVKETKEEKEEWIKPWVPKKKNDVDESMTHKFQRLANIKEYDKVTSDAEPDVCAKCGESYWSGDPSKNPENLCPDCQGAVASDRGFTQMTAQTEIKTEGWAMGDYTPEQEAALKTLSRAGYKEVSTFPDHPDAEGEGVTPQVIVVVQKRPSNFGTSQCEVDPQGLCNGLSVLNFLKQQVREGVGASEPFVTKWKMDKEKAGMVKKEAGALSEVEKIAEIINIVEKMDRSRKTSPLLEKARRFLMESYNDPSDILQGAADVQSGQIDSLIQTMVAGRAGNATPEDVAASVVAKAEDMGMKDASGKYDYIVSIVTKMWGQKL